MIRVWQKLRVGRGGVEGVGADEWERVSLGYRFGSPPYRLTPQMKTGRETHISNANLVMLVSETGHISIEIFSCGASGASEASGASCAHFRPDQHILPRSAYTAII